jgi:pyruvate ferredoxin oxidoreductase alpha subunit
MDGAAITHVSTPVEKPPKEGVTEFLPPYKPPYPLDPAFGPVSKAQHIAPSLIGPEQRKLIDVSMKNSVEVIREAWKDYSRYVGKEYPPFLESTLMKDADVAMVSMGAYTKDAIYAAKRLREHAVKAGVVRLRYWRPFPADELREALQGVKAVGVLDFSYGMGSPDFAGAFFNDIRSALYQSSSKPPLICFILAGGREPTVKQFEQAIRMVREAAQTGKVSKLVNWITLRGEDV